MKQKDTLTVILVPGKLGRTVQFNAPRRLLIGLVTAGALGIAFSLLSVTLWTRARIRDARADRSARSAEALYRDRYEETRRIHEAYVAESETRIREIEAALRRMEDFTGLPLLDADPEAEPEESSSNEPEPLGRGGAPHPVLGSIVLESLRAYDREEFERLEGRLADLEAYRSNVAGLLGRLETQAAALRRTPLICPVDGEASITDRFGRRIHPVHKRVDFHRGLDIAARGGTPILAPADGVVTIATRKTRAGYYLEIDHGRGASFDMDGGHLPRYRTRYMHCRQLLAKKGDRVERGQPVAEVGSTGVSTGNHLHYEVHVDGQPVDPEPFILDRWLD